MTSAASLGNGLTNCLECRHWLPCHKLEAPESRQAERPSGSTHYELICAAVRLLTQSKGCLKFPRSLPDLTQRRKAASPNGASVKLAACEAPCARFGHQ